MNGLDGIKFENCVAKVKAKNKRKSEKSDDFYYSVDVAAFDFSGRVNVDEAQWEELKGETFYHISGHISGDGFNGMLALHVTKWEPQTRAKAA